MSSIEPDPFADDAATGAQRSATTHTPGADRGTGIMWTAVAILVAIALAVIASFQNTQDVEVRFLWIEGSVPLVLLLLIAVGTTVVVTEAIGVVWRYRRRRRRRERAELNRLRND